MKIFNWMHKKFHHNTLTDGFASNLKKNEPPMKNLDSEALLKQVALTDWKVGILTIGTLGYDPLNSINHHHEYFAFEAEDKVIADDHDHVMLDDDHDHDHHDANCYSAEQEELNPLMYNTFEHNFKDVIVSENDGINEIVQVPPPTLVVYNNEVMESNDVESDEKKKKVERITLADLFLADSDVKMKIDPFKVKLESSEKSNFKAKHGLSFAKKLIPRVKDNPHPMKDIKKLMKKMLKRKIHPDLEVKNQKPEEEVSEEGNVDNHMNESNDSIYFLPI